MAEFFFAHEYGHLRYGHAGGALTHEDGEVSSLRQRQELDADCYAARVLAEQHREAVETATPLLPADGALPVRRVPSDRRPAGGEDPLLPPA